MIASPYLIRTFPTRNGQMIGTEVTASAIAIATVIATAIVIAIL